MKKCIKKQLVAFLLMLAVLCNVSIFISASAAHDFEIWVGGVGMHTGEYLPSGARTPTSLPPSEGGYAYYENGTLTLCNYSYGGIGYEYSDGYFAGIYRNGNLKLVLEGENSILMSEADGISVEGDLTVTGAGVGSLTLHADYGLYSANGKITVDGGRLDVIAARYGVFAPILFAVNGGSLDIRSTATASDASYRAICSTALPQFANGLTILASDDPNGTLSEYDTASLTTYDRILIGAPAPTVHTSLAFTLSGYEVGSRIEDVSVTSVDDAVLVGGDYGADLVILDEMQAPLTAGEFCTGVRYALRLLFRKRSTDVVEIDPSLPAQITLNGIGASMFETSDDVFTVTFPLPILEPTGTPIASLSLSLSGYRYGASVDELVVVSNEAPLCGIATVASVLDPFGTLLASDATLGNGRHELAVRFCSAEGYHFELLSKELVSLDGIPARSLTYEEIGGTVYALFRFSLPYLTDGIIRSVLLSAPADTPIAGNALYYPSIKSVNGEECLIELLTGELFWSSQGSRYTEENFASGQAYTLMGRLTPTADAEFDHALTVSLETPSEAALLSHRISLDGICEFQKEYDLTDRTESDMPAPPVTPSIPSSPAVPPEESEPIGSGSLSEQNPPGTPQSGEPAQKVAPDQETATEPQSTLDMGTIVGIAAGSVALLGAAALFFRIRRRKKSSTSAT